MHHYIYCEPRKSLKAWVKIIIVTILVTVIATTLLVSCVTRNRIQELNSAIVTLQKREADYKQKETYYKEIESKFFQEKAKGATIQRYEDQLLQKEKEKQEELEQKEQEISSLNQYVDELSDQAAALENSVHNLSSLSSVYPKNFTYTTKVSRGSYERGASANNLEYVGVWTMTAYAPTKEECGNDLGITKSGSPVEPGQNIAIDPAYWDFGQKFYIEGYGEVIATDVGSAIKGRNRLDFCVLDPAIAKSFGSKKVKVWLIKE